MSQSNPPGRFTAKWFWIITLLALFILVIAWFANPLGDVVVTSNPERAADSAESTTAPATPGVEVNLPQTPMKNTPASPSASPTD